MNPKSPLAAAPRPGGRTIGGPGSRSGWYTKAVQATLIATVLLPPVVASPWALEETFDGDPPSPSQALLPRNFDYVVTHRTHPQEQFTKAYRPFLADHDEACNGPDPDVFPLPQREVRTVQTSNGDFPDESFFVCKHHMMSSMGEVEWYSLASFWPRQEFDFSDGGTLEFDVNINLGHTFRHWWEVMIVPRDQLKVAAGPVDAAIDETYPRDRIVFSFRDLVRHVKVGTGAKAPDGWLVDDRHFGRYDWARWGDLHPDDPALADRRLRRTMRIRLASERIVWGIETADGTFDERVVDVPGGLPFERGLVVFKTHAYTPEKDGNYDTYTFHWDNIRFDGPVTGRYEVHAADDVVYLQANGDRRIGDTQTVTVMLPDVGENPVLFGQINQPMRGQVLLSVNGGPDIEVAPYEYDRDDCWSGDWKSFRLPLEPDWLEPGLNTLQWTVGPRPGCAVGSYPWNGFSAKFLQIQMDEAGAVQPPAPPIPIPPVADSGAVWIAPPVTTYEGGPMDSDSVTFVWQEAIDHLLTRPLRVNATQPGILSGSRPLDGEVAAGTRVCSYAVHGDRRDDNGELVGRLRLPGQRVLGLVTTSRGLAGAMELDAPSVSYSGQGLERSDTIDWRNAVDGAAVSWSLRFGGGVDTFRIVTDCGR